MEDIEEAIKFQYYKPKIYDKLTLDGIPLNLIDNIDW